MRCFGRSASGAVVFRGVVLPPPHRGGITSPLKWTALEASNNQEAKDFLLEKSEENIIS